MFVNDPMKFRNFLKSRYAKKSIIKQPGFLSAFAAIKKKSDQLNKYASKISSVADR